MGNHPVRPPSHQCKPPIRGNMTSRARVPLFDNPKVDSNPGISLLGKSTTAFKSARSSSSREVRIRVPTFFYSLL